jgi:voltage-gated potassium channel
VLESRYAVIIKALGVALVVLLVGTVGYIAIEDMNVLDAVYMTTITITTIGFKEVVELSDQGRMWTMLLAFLGIGVILLIAGELAHAVVDADIRRLFGQRRDHRMLNRLTDHIVVCGYGRMGRAVVDTLRERKLQFVVVETDADRCRGLEDEHIHVVQGDATRPEVLETAKVARARTFIACLADDAHNVFSILLARQLNPEITIIARAVEEESEERLQLAGADRVINPYRLGGMRLAFTAIKPSVMDFIEASLPGTGMELELAEVRVTSSSDLVGKTLAGAELRKRFGVIVVALMRGERSTFNPGPDEHIEAGDILVALGPTGALDAIERASH